MTTSDLKTAQDLIEHSLSAGADEADALCIQHQGLTVDIRDGMLENLEHAQEAQLGLRVFCGKRSAIISLNNPTPQQSKNLAQRAVTMAKTLPEDPYNGLCPQSRPFQIEADSLDLVDDNHHPSTEELIKFAQEAEKTALDIKGVSKSAGSDAGWERTRITLANSQGFSGSYRKSYFSGAACVLAGAGDTMQRDYDFHCTVFYDALKTPQEIGRKAAQNTVARLNPIQPKTGRYPVVFAPRVAQSFLGHFAQLTNGKAIASGTSLLKDKLGTSIFPQNISIKDDPHLPRGLRSRPFDGEGMPTKPLYPVRDGQLQYCFLDYHSATQLGLKTNGQAGRSALSQPRPTPTNLYFEPGTLSPKDFISDIQEGIYVTEMMGMSLNPLTGDYSRGASGFMIRGGAICEPISGFTLAGNLLEIFKTLSLANDLKFQFSMNSPTLRTEALKVAGS